MEPRSERVARCTHWLEPVALQPVLQHVLRDKVAAVTVDADLDAQGHKVVRISCLPNVRVPNPVRLPAYDVARMVVRLQKGEADDATIQRELAQLPKDVQKVTLQFDAGMPPAGVMSTEEMAAARRASVPGYLREWEEHTADGAAAAHKELQGGKRARFGAQGSSDTA